MTRFVFLDRDGTLIVERNYLADPDQVELTDGAAPAVRRLRESGYAVAVVTNQSGVGRGYFGMERVDAVHERMRELLARQGAFLDGIYVCPHAPDEECACRKPGVGLIEAAARERGLDRERSFIIGDNRCDIECGKNMGIVSILVRTGYGSEMEQEIGPHADFVAGSLLEAVEWILMKDEIEPYLEASAVVLSRAARTCSDSIARSAQILTDAFRAGGKLLLCGNGGSAADCQHMAAEFVSRFAPALARPPIPALALTTDTSFLTAFSNDIGYEGVFERQVRAHGRAGDVLLAISTSGNSRNVLAAVRAAKDLGLSVIGLTGPSGELAALCDVAIAVPTSDTQHMQEAHIAIEHLLCGLVERTLYNGSQT